MGIFHSIISLFHKSAAPVMARNLAQVYQSPASQRALTHTPLEQVLCRQYDEFQAHPNEYDTLVITVIPKSSADTVAKNPVTGMGMRATYQDSLMTRKQALEYCDALPKTIAQLEVSKRPEFLAMLIDLNGGPIEQQVPGWRPGTMKIPDRFLHNPLVTIPRAGTLNELAFNGTFNLPGNARTCKEHIPDYMRGVITGGRGPHHN